MHLVENFDDVPVGQADAAMGNGLAQQVFAVGAVEVDVTGETVDAWTAIDTILTTIEGQDAGQDQIIRGIRGCKIAGENDSSGFAAFKDGAERMSLPYSLVNAV